MVSPDTLNSKIESLEMRAVQLQRELVALELEIDTLKSAISCLRHDSNNLNSVIAMRTEIEQRRT